MDKIYTVKMPDIGEGVVEGEVIEWLKKIDEFVAQDEPVVVLMTDKATVELPSPHPGKIVKHYYQAGETAIRDKPLYDIELEVGSIEKSNAPAQDLEAPPLRERKQKQTPPLPSSLSPAQMEEGEVQATPHVRHLAKELGIDIAKVKGTGKQGRVTEEDLKKFSEKQSVAPSSAPSEDEEVPLVGVRHLMVKKMEISHQQIPPFSYFEEVDASRLILLREKLKDKASEKSLKLTFMPFLIRALSLTIIQFPLINSSLNQARTKVILHKKHNIGVAMATEQGLIVPVLKDVQTMNLESIVKAYEALKQKAIHGKLQPADMKEGTVTISNFGVSESNGLWATPIINYPEVAILAVAKIQKQPIVKQDAIAIGNLMHFSWSFDHRVIDGNAAAAISHFYSHLISNPASLL